MEPTTSNPASERFPLFERAERLGVLDGESALIVAPTATGKSYIGRQAVERALVHRNGHTHAYLVPFRSLAAEVYDQFLDRFGDGDGVRVRIATGDYRDAVHPEETDLLVATYESFAGLLRTTGFRPGIIVADEIHLVADAHRGPVVEGLLARLLQSGRTDGLCALSAVVENGEEMANWLDIQLLQGSPEDRPVELTLEHRAFTDRDEDLVDVLRPCADHAQQALVFCSSRAAAEKAARGIQEAFGETLARPGEARYALSGRIQESDPDLNHLPDLVLKGVAFHHAGLVKSVRRSVEDAFRKGAIGVITCTPTLAAGVNLPAEIVVVRDIFRTDVLRGRMRRVLLSSGEVLNMLGRAGRPGQASHGMGVAMIPEDTLGDPRVEGLMQDIDRRRGGAVRSQLPSSFDAIMRFVLAVVAERGEATQEDVVGAYERTLAYRDHPEPIRFDRPFEDDMMEDIPSWEKVVKAKGDIHVGKTRLLPDGVHATVLSEKKNGTDTYEVVVGVTGIECNCPAATKWHRREVCKHAACAIHHLLFEDGVDPEKRARAIYNCGEVFAQTLDIGTKLDNALKILTMWELLERVPAGWRTTPVGMLAASSWFDLLLLRVAAERAKAPGEPSHEEIAQWAVEDYFAEEKKRKQWAPAVRSWLGEVDTKKIKLPSRYRGDFEQGLEDLARVCRLYESAAEAVGNEGVRLAARDAARALRYGVAPELVPLMALRFDYLGRARCRALFEKGVHNVADLAGASLDTLADPRRLPGALLGGWIRSAARLQEARSEAGAEALAEGDPLFDDLVARFRLDPAALDA